MFEIPLNYFSIQDFLYFPVIVLILTLFFNRNKIQLLRNFNDNIDVILNSKFKISIYILINVTISLFLGFMISSITFPFSDVDNAMAGAIQAFFIKGLNPYMTNVSPHIFILSSGTYTIYGPYNYGPIDLICYGIGYLLFSPFVGNSWWLFISNVVLSMILYLGIIRNMIHLPDRMIIGPYILVTSFFLQDNVFLMVIFLALALWVQLRITNNVKYPLIIFILTLGVFTKLYLAFVLLGYFVYVFKSNIKFLVINSIVSVFTAIIVMIPFGISNVIKSIFIFQVNLNIRSNYATIQGGIPRYLGLVNLNWINIPLSLILVIIFIIICEKYAKDEINIKFTLFTILNLTLLPVSGYEFFIIPGFFMLYDYYQKIMVHYSNKLEVIEKINVNESVVSIT